MTDKDLATITHFSKAEILATGGNPTGLSFSLFQKLDHLRNLLGQAMHLLPGGLNSGHHISDTDVHAKGLAADFFTSANYDQVFRATLAAGLHGFGAYWNGVDYSYHVDDRPDFAFWFATKKLGDADWSYSSFKILDPRSLA